LNAFLVLFPDIFFSPLVTIPVTPMITGMTKHFMFYIRWISVLKFLYFNFFSDSFCITFLSDGIDTSISKQTLSFLFLIIMSGLFARTSLSVCILWFHSTVYYYYYYWFLYYVYISSSCADSVIGSCSCWVSTLK
jgi:hypothetical protein